MAEPRTWLLIEAMATCLARITVAGGYLTDAGAALYREPSQIPDPEQGGEAPAALITLALDGIGPATDPALRIIGNLVTVVVIGKVPIGQTDAQIRLHELLADITQCFTNRQADFPVGLEWPKFLEAKPVPPVPGMSWIGVEARFASNVRMR